MLSENKTIIAAAGSGKTTKIVRDSSKNTDEKVLVVTYTQNNRSEIQRKYWELTGVMPRNVVVDTWFIFLLRDCLRPYQNFLLDKRIGSICFINGKSAPYVKKADIRKYYFDSETRVYTDKLSEFACLCQESSGGAVINRLSSLYDRIYIDEVQDLAGYDLEFVELLLQSDVNVTMVGDNRQATYSTNNSPKNKKFAGPKILDKFLEWNKQGLLAIDELTFSYRCSQAICDLADSLYPMFSPTQSKKDKVTGHDGIFLVKDSDVPDYVGEYEPQILRFDRRTKTYGANAINFGESKGMTFDRVLIYPSGPIKKWLATGDYSNISKSDISLAKLYVALTRARFSVGFVFDKETKIPNTLRYQKGLSLIRSGAFYQAILRLGNEKPKRSSMNMCKVKAVEIVNQKN